MCGEVMMPSVMEEARDKSSDLNQSSATLTLQGSSPGQFYEVGIIISIISITILQRQG